MNMITNLRKALGWSQAEMGEHLGCTRQYVSDLERGRKRPSVEMAYDMIYLAKLHLPKVGNPLRLEDFLPDERVEG